MNKKWNELPMSQRAAYIRQGVFNGLRNVEEVRDYYNKFAGGGYLSSQDDNYIRKGEQAVTGEGPWNVPLERIDDEGVIYGGMFPEVTVTGNQDRSARIDKAIKEGMNPIEAYKSQVYDAMSDYEKQGFPSETHYLAAQGDPFSQKALAYENTKPVENTSPEFMAATAGAGLLNGAVKGLVGTVGTGLKAGSTMLGNGIKTGLGYIAPGATSLNGLITSPFMADNILGISAGGLINEGSKSVLDGGIDQQLGGFGSFLNPGYYLGTTGVGKKLSNLQDRLGNTINERVIKPYNKWNRLEERARNLQQGIDNYNQALNAARNKNSKLQYHTVYSEPLEEQIPSKIEAEALKSGFVEDPNNPGIFKLNKSSENTQSTFVNPITGETNTITYFSPNNQRQISLDVNPERGARHSVGISKHNMRTHPNVHSNNAIYTYINDWKPTSIKNTSIPITDSNQVESISVNTAARNSMGAYLQETKKGLTDTIGGDFGFTGSTLLAERGLIHKAPGDMEVFALRKDVDGIQQYFGARGVESETHGMYKISNTGNGANKAINGSYDIDIVETVGDDPNASAVGKLAHQIYASLHPTEYRNLVQEASKRAMDSGTLKLNPNDIPLPLSGRQLLAEYNSGNNAIKCQIQNYLSSSAEKHAKHFNSILVNTEYAPLVRESIIDKGKAMIKGYQDFQTAYPNVTFDNIEANKAFLREMGFNEKYANNPEIVKNIAEKAHLDMVHTRSVSTSDPFNPFESLTTNTAKARAAGAGGNTTFGDNGGGFFYGNLTGALQRNFAKDLINTPEDFVKMNKKIDRKLNVPFTKEEKNKVLAIIGKYGFGVDRVDNISDLDRIIIDAGSHQSIVDNSLMTKELADALGIPGAIGFPYNGNRSNPGNYFGSYSTPVAYGFSLNNGKISPFERGVRTLDFNTDVLTLENQDIKKLNRALNGFNSGSGKVQEMFPQFVGQIKSDGKNPNFDLDNFIAKRDYFSNSNIGNVGIDPRFNAEQMLKKAQKSLDMRTYIPVYGGTTAAVAVPSGLVLKHNIDRNKKIEEERRKKRIRNYSEKKERIFRERQGKKEIISDCIMPEKESFYKTLSI